MWTKEERIKKVCFEGEDGKGYKGERSDFTE
jgi:hypothetical protein